MPVTTATSQNNAYFSHSYASSECYWSSFVLQCGDRWEHISECTFFNFFLVPCASNTPEEVMLNKVSVIWWWTAVTKAKTRGQSGCLTRYEECQWRITASVLVMFVNAIQALHLFHYYYYKNMIVVDVFNCSLCMIIWRYMTASPNVSCSFSPISCGIIRIALLGAKYMLDTKTHTSHDSITWSEKVN